MAVTNLLTHFITEHFPAVFAYAGHTPQLVFHYFRYRWVSQMGSLPFQPSFGRRERNMGCRWEQKQRCKEVVTLLWAFHVIHVLRGGKRWKKRRTFYFKARFSKMVLGSQCPLAVGDSWGNSAPFDAKLVIFYFLPCHCHISFISTSICSVVIPTDPVQAEAVSCWALPGGAGGDACSTKRWQKEENHCHGEA